MPDPLDGFGGDSACYQHKLCAPASQGLSVIAARCGGAVLGRGHRLNPRGPRNCITSDQHGMSFRGLTQLHFTPEGQCSEKTVGKEFKNWDNAEQMHGV